MSVGTADPAQEPLEQPRVPTDPDPLPDEPINPYWGDPSQSPGRGTPEEDPDPVEPDPA